MHPLGSTGPWWRKLTATNTWEYASQKTCHGTRVHPSEEGKAASLLTQAAEKV